MMCLKLANLMKKMKSWQESSGSIFEVHHLIAIQGRIDENFTKHQTNKVTFSKYE